ncbi:MAG: glycosyltransferase [Ruminococcaceae bacterium]|nr:glycosyltransferase [Oscillospiraceae bacterium]
MKKVLVISYTSLISSTPNGRTMQSLLQNIPAENISLFCCYGVPDKGNCASCYKVSNKDAVNSLFKANCAGGVIDACVDHDPGEELKKDQRNGPRKAWKYVAKELIWLLGRWKNKKFKSWLHEQNADCVVYMYGDQASLQNLAVYASKELNIPLVVYSCEDYCLKDYNYLDRKKASIWFWIYQKLSLAATRRLFRQAAGLITNSDKLGEELAEKYGISNVSTVMMASQMEFIRNGEVRSTEDTTITYLGALGTARIQALTEIGDALQKIDSRLKLDIYGRTTDALKEQLESCPGIRYHGFVSYEKVQQVMRSSSLLIEAINNDPYVVKNKRYGFSTKYADCFACGTPLLVYAPAGIIETAFALEHNCAFVATSVDALEQTLRTALFDQDARNRQLDAAKKVTDMYFNKEKNIQTVASMLSGAVSKK